MKKNYWKNKSVFITGCTGLLGSWMVKELLERGANITGLIRDSVPKSNLYLSGVFPEINIVRGSVEDLFLLERILSDYEIDIIFHLAAQTIVNTANINQLSTFEKNIKGTWNILEAARHTAEIQSIIIASSDKAYGEKTRLPYDETSPLTGEHPYDVSKSCADLIARTYYVSYGLPVCITRCGNFFGGGDLNFNRIVPGVIRSVIFNEPPIIRSDGSNIRDYFYVRDAALAYIHLAEKMSEIDIKGEGFNFSAEIKLSVVEMMNIILKLMNREDLQPIILDKTTNEIKHQYLSAEKARKVLNWTPKFSVESGLQETIKWYEEFFNVQNTGKDNLWSSFKTIETNS